MSPNGLDGLTRYKALIESRMLGERDGLTGSEGETVERQLRRGWYVGSALFGRGLAGKIVGVSDNLRGEQRRAHGEQEAERLLGMALDVLEMEESALQEMKSTRLEKQAVAWLLKKHTTVTGVWIAERLGMGHRVNTSRAVSAIEKCTDKKSRAIKKQMMQCTG